MSYRDNYKLIDFSKEIVLPPKREKLPPARSSLPAPRIASDVMEPVQSMLDGKLYDSKSALRSTYRQAGVTEIGNDPGRNKPFVRQSTPRREIKDVVDRARARVERGERNLFKGK
ncbi:hypothetical protein JJC00_18780 [Bradyrhizobium diazoefficiens]|uniref:hypothetical protein n=1 Tax=Bradyrhizobium diazoefficiens TaxID=1355477 RepID=UPI00190D5058|nr:hypothetical protein [Bradyrhizobium diazoefficiens]QQO30731.1 hypothetical protein JJC00_18780 [Bradyrhizobium diazoefficiens]